MIVKQAIHSGGAFANNSSGGSAMSSNRAELFSRNYSFVSIMLSLAVAFGLITHLLNLVRNGDPRDFHNTVDHDAYCLEHKLGRFALGVQSVNPWTDVLLCLGPEGVREVSATRNGREVSEPRLIPGTGAHRETIWTPESPDDISVDAKVLEGCPGYKPLAIMPNQMDEYPTGVTIHTGAVFCFLGDSLVYDTAPWDWPTSSPAMKIWPNFTPL